MKRRIDTQLAAQPEPYKDALDDAYVHGYTAAVAKFYQWQKEHNPCADAVSRADVINFLCDWICAPGERCASTCKCLKGIRELPPVKPVRDCSGCRFKFLPERKEDNADVVH